MWPVLQGELTVSTLHTWVSLNAHPRAEGFLKIDSCGGLRPREARSFDVSLPNTFGLLQPGS